MAGKAGRRVGKLSARYVETVKVPGFYTDGGGLYLNVQQGRREVLDRAVVGGRQGAQARLGATHTVRPA